MPPHVARSARVTDAPPDPPAPRRTHRIAAALGIAFLAAALRLRAMSLPGGKSDFAQLWIGARELLAGRDPYAAVGPGRLLEWHTGLVFPMPAVLVAVPFSALPYGVADAAFAAVSVAILAYVLTARGWDALPWFAGFPMFYAVLRVQWSPLLTAAALVPALGALFVAKPTIGAAMGAYRPTRRAIVGGIALLALSFAVDLHWVARWLAALHETTYQSAARPVVMSTYSAPVARPGGFLVLLGLLRWRRPEARMLVALACVPQTLVVYEMVPLVLVAASRREVLLLTFLSWSVYLVNTLNSPYPDWPAFVRTSSLAEVWLLLIPATVLVLRRPNVGELAPWVERWLARVRRRVPGLSFGPASEA